MLETRGLLLRRREADHLPDPSVGLTRSKLASQPSPTTCRFSPVVRRRAPSQATGRSGRTPKTGAGALSNSPMALSILRGRLYSYQRSSSGRHAEINAQQAQRPFDRSPEVGQATALQAVDTPPRGSEWLHEIKYDGYRVHLASTASAAVDTFGPRLNGPIPADTRGHISPRQATWTGSSAAFAPTGRPLSVESRCGAVAVGRTYLLPPLSFGGALVARP
jgi:hypothetical protein